MTDTVVETTEQSDAPTAIPHWISGARREGKGRTAPVYNPALGRVVSEVGLASADEVSEAIATAKVRDNVAFEGSGGWFIGDGRDLVGRFADSDFLYARLKYYF